MINVKIKNIRLIIIKGGLVLIKTKILHSGVLRLIKLLSEDCGGSYDGSLKN